MASEMVRAKHRTLGVRGVDARVLCKARGRRHGGGARHAGDGADGGGDGVVARGRRSDMRAGGGAVARGRRTAATRLRAGSRRRRAWAAQGGAESR
jgi:hypothetical protein